MSDDVWKMLPELQEEPFSWFVLIGIHLQSRSKVLAYVLKHSEVISAEERGRGYGYGFMSRAEHGPAVGSSFGDEE